MGAWRVDLPKLKEVTVMDGALANCRNLVALGNDAAQWNIGRAFGKLRSVECRRTSAVGAKLRAVVPGIRVIEKCHFLLKETYVLFLGTGCRGVLFIHCHGCACFGGDCSRKRRTGYRDPEVRRLFRVAHSLPPNFQFRSEDHDLGNVCCRYAS